MDERFEDPSESTSCEATLTEGNHFIESLLEVTNGILYIYDLAEHRNVFANEGIQRSLGYSAAEIRELGDSVLPSLMHPDDHRHYIGEIVPRYSQVADRERIVNRYRMKNRSGDWRWIESTEIVYRRDADGAPRQIMGLGIDITERKAAETALEDAKETLSEFVLHSPIYTFIKDVAPTESRVLIASDNYKDMVGISGRDMVGKTMAELFPPEFAEKITADDWKVASKGELLRLDEELDGRSYTTIKFPIHKGDRVFLAGYTIDITERKAAEKELERHRDHLEELVAQRTAQLESANKELDAFCHSVSHDLRAPLRYLDGFAGLLVSNCREDLSDEGRRYVDIVASYAKRMGCLIDDLLEFSRTSRQEMSMQQVNMELALREALVPVQSASRGRDIEWRIGKLRPVGGDHNLLRQVWANLVENAVKYTAKKDAALIEIGCEPVGTEIVFSVRDNGAGFDPRYADRLFGVFQRLHRSEEFEGTGIGLATVHRILSRHGGRIWAESAVDQGATFRFALPVPIQEAPSPEPS